MSIIDETDADGSALPAELYRSKPSAEDAAPAPSVPVVFLRSTVFSILAEAYAQSDDPPSDTIEALLEARLGSKLRHLQQIGVRIAACTGLPNSSDINVIIEICDSSPGLAYAVALELGKDDPNRTIHAFAFRSSDTAEHIKRVLGTLERKPMKCLIVRKFLSVEGMEATKRFISVAGEASTNLSIVSVKTVLATVPPSESNGVRWRALIHAT